MREIALTQGKVALVDDEDYERCIKFSWCAYQPNKLGKFYACRSVVRNGKRTTEQLHTFILDAAGTVDHKNGDGLDCRKENLRTATPAQNARNRGKQRNNSSGYKGVFPSHPSQTSWVARIRMHGKPIHLGSFSSKEDAARAYDAAVLRLHGEFAKTNFGSATDD